MHDNAGSVALVGEKAAVSVGTFSSPLPPLLPRPRMVAAPATPIANSVMTVRAPLATDRSARNSVTSRISAKKPAAANVSHIGKVADRQN